jgi:hypothetical protein
MCWAVAQVGEIRNANKFCWGKPLGNLTLYDQEKDGRITPK